MNARSGILALSGLFLLMFFSVGCVRSEGPDAVLAEAARLRHAEKHENLVRKTITKKIDYSSGSTDEQVLADLALSLRKSHEIFSEVWAHLWEDRIQRPMSVFSELSRVIQSHIDPATGKAQLYVNRCDDVVPRASEIRIQRNSQKLISSISFNNLPCKVGKAVPSEIANLNLVMTSNGVQKGVWTFYAENLPRSAGSSLAFLREKINCDMGFDSRRRLDNLNCKNLGQNRDAELHMRFDRFDYKKNRETLVLAEGKKYKLLTTAVCDEPKFCTQVKVPLAGRIEIFEDLVSQDARDAQKKAVAEEERKDAQAALEKRIIEQKKEAQKNAAKNNAMIHDANFNQTGAEAAAEAHEAAQVPAQGLPGEPFGGRDGAAPPPASAVYAPPTSVHHDPAAQSGSYEFNHSGSGDINIERQAMDGMIR